MPWQFTPYVIPCLIAAVVSFVVANLAWRRRSTSGALPLVFLALAVAEWSLGYAFELASADRALQILWAKAEYLGIAFAPVAWFAFALQYTDQRDAYGKPYLIRRTVVALSVEPLVTLLLAWTNDLHGLIWSHIGLDTHESFTMLDLTHGNWFWIHITYSYILLLLGTLLLIRYLARSPQFYWSQTGALLLGASAPWLANALYVLGLGPISHLDLTPFAFALSAMAIAWGIFRRNLFDLVPIARDMIIENMGDGVIVLDLQRRVVDINPAAQRMIGRSASEVIGRIASQVFSEHTDWVERYQGRSEIHEELVAGRGSAQSVFEINISSLNNRHQIMGQVVILRDVTERKRKEQVLKASEAYAHSIIDNSLDMIITTDTERRIAEFNPAAQKIFGYTREEVLGKHIDMLYANPKGGAAIRQALLEEGKFVGEVCNIRKNGKPFISHLSASTLRGANGELLGIVGVSRDITERKQAEEALRESQERFSGAFEHAAIGMALVSPDGSWLKVNHVLCELTGYSENELLSKTFQDITHPDDLETDLTNVQKMLAGAIHAYQMEKRYIHKSGQIVWILLNVSLVRGAQGEPLHFVAQIQDITGRKQAEAVLQRRADEFAALYDITHDLARQQDLPSLLRTIVDRAATLIAAPGGGIYLYDAERGDLSLVAPKGHELTAGLRLRLGEGLAGRVAQSRQPILVDDYSRWEHRSSQFEGIQISAAVQVPMLYGGDLIGVLAIHEIERTERKFTDTDARLLELFAGQAAGAVHIARLLAETQRRADELSALYEVTRDLATQYDLPKLLQTIVDRAMTLLAAPNAFVYLYDSVQRNLELRLVTGVALPLGTRLELGEGMAGRVAQSYQPLIVDDYQTWEHRSRKFEGIPFRAILGVPMHHGGELIGVVAVNEIGSMTRQFTEADARLLSLFAGQAASAVYNARLHSAEREEHQFTEILHEIGIALTSQLDPNAILDQLLKQVERVVPLDSAAVLLLEENQVRCKRQRGYEKLGLATWMERFEMPLSGFASLTQIAQTGRPYISSDTFADPNWTVIEKTRHIRSWMGAPIMIRGTLSGFLVLDKFEPGFYTDNMAVRLEAFATQASLALDNARLYAQEQLLAITDDLTGLSNRRHFMELAHREFLRAHRQQSPCAVLMIDLNDFKRVNDTFGHSAGDEALRRVAKTLASHVREVDIVARYGGDEFVILLPDCRLPKAREIAARLQEQSQTLQISIADQSAALSFSVGIAVATLMPEETLDSLLTRADTEMYLDKRQHEGSGQVP